MKKIVLMSVSLLICLTIAIPCIAGGNERKVPTDEPDSTYLDSLKRARLKRFHERSEHLKEQARKDIAPNVPGLIETLSDTSRYRRQIAAMQLGCSQDEQVVPYLEKLLLEDPASNVRAQCATSLATLESIESQPVLIEAMNDFVEEVQLRSALALVFLGDTTYCIPVLEDLWKFGDRRTRLAINQGLKDIGTKRAIQNLRKAMNDEDPQVAVGAAIRLAELGYCEDAFPRLKKMLTHSDKHIRSAAVRGLAEIGDATSLQLIKGMLNDKSPYVRQYIRTILKSYFNIEVPPDDKLENSMRNYDSDAAVAYADEWWDGRNLQDYDNYSPPFGNGDCANFVSQCLKEGGLDLSAGWDGYGGGVDDYGCIPYCDHLHIHLMNYQDVTLYERLSEDDWPQEPDWFVKGDPAIYNEADNLWKHAVFARVGDEYNWARLSSHDPDVGGPYNDVRVYWFYDENPNLVSCDFYHIPPVGASVEDNSISFINELKPNFPNPFHSSTTISFFLQPRELGAKSTEIKIYNIKGQLIKQVSIDNHQSSIVWNGKDESGNQLSSGIYLYQLVNGNKVIDTKRMLLIR
ncbi:MAG: HEAT repeat domain-containing protein [Candidatus Cloacimonadota bacterium]|nr:HEAT repeat domain-containing protein [Candidatus Cloacimonadota bacterium]